MLKPINSDIDLIDDTCHERDQLYELKEYKIER